MPNSSQRKKQHAQRKVAAAAARNRTGRSNVEPAPATAMNLPPPTRQAQSKKHEILDLPKQESRGQPDDDIESASQVLSRLRKMTTPGNPKNIYPCVGKLGNGGFGTVYRAKKPWASDVAIKVQQVKMEAKHIAKQIAELQFLQQMVPVGPAYINSYLVNDNELWTVMELINGIDLHVLSSKFQLKPQHIAAICKDVLNDLANMHRIGIAHHDLKPANIMISASGRATLIDFGEVKQMGTAVKRAGTPRFGSPEVWAQTGVVTYAVDIWGLGMTVVQMYNSQPPYSEFGKGDEAKSLMAKMILNKKKPRLKEPVTDPAFKDFLVQISNFNPEERPTAEELLKHTFIRHAASRDEMQNLVKYAMSGNGESTLTAFW